MSSCRACGAQIQFGTNDHTGKSTPMDTVAVDDGNMVWVDGTRVHVLTNEEKLTDTRLRFKSHFATCPEGPAFRNKPRPSAADARAAFEKGKAEG